MGVEAEKLEDILSLSESDFRKEVIIPLLKKMGYRQVRERHGTQEFGKDITFLDHTKLGDTYCAVVVKTGDISGSASGKDNLQTVMNQVEMAFSVPVYDAEEKLEHNVDRVLVWASGDISNNAETQIKSHVDKHRNVIFVIGHKTLEYLEEYYPAFFTFRDPVISDYFSSAKIHYSRIEELRTLGTSCDKQNLPLIFVPPTFVIQSPKRAKQNGKTIQNERKSYSYEYLLHLDENIVIRGEAGSGKTTLLRRMLIDIIENNEKSHQKEPIPIIIKILQLDLDSEHFIEAALHKEFRRFGSLIAEDNIELDLSKVVVLLDGLDELKSKEQINLAIKSIEEFHRDYPDTRIVITSRMLGVLENPDVFVNFKKFEMKDLEPEQIMRFIENWYGKESLTGQKLIQLLVDPDRLGGLPATPFTLTIMAILQENNPFQEIPANQTELFSKYIELALGRWDTSKSLSLQFKYPVKRFLLQNISWDLHNKQTDYISPADFETWISLLEEEFGDTIDSNDFRQEIIERSELIFQNDEGNYEFKHRSFRDYFVGLEINRQANAKDILVKHFFEPWWAQAIFFAFGLLPDRDDYLLEVLDRVHPKPEENITYAIQAGVLSQAAFMASKHTRTRLVRSGLRKLVQSWNYLCDVYEEIDSIEEKPQLFRDIPPQILFLIFQAGIAKIAFGSVTLAQVLRELTDEAMKCTYQELEEDQAILFEWSTFLLAIACASSETNINNFFQLMESGQIHNPYYQLIAKFFAETIGQSKLLDEGTKEKGKALAARLDAKLDLKVRPVTDEKGRSKAKANEEFRNAFYKREMLRLPPSISSE